VRSRRQGLGGARERPRTDYGDFGAPSDIAAVVAFLASDEGRWVTAQTIEASGGYRL
jgi:NAD(P)-dependent dehydrogenase (short-subunit alcohol dehydrogenase family)